MLFRFLHATFQARPLHRLRHHILHEELVPAIGNGGWALRAQGIEQSWYLVQVAGAYQLLRFRHDCEEFGSVIRGDCCQHLFPRRLGIPPAEAALGMSGKGAHVLDQR